MISFLMEIRFVPICVVYLGISSLFFIYHHHFFLHMLYQTTKLSLSHNKEPTLNKNVLETIPLSAIHIVGSI